MVSRLRHGNPLGAPVDPKRSLRDRQDEEKTDQPASALPATKADVEAHFATHGTGEITEIKLMNGFGFIEYKDAMDARDVVPGKSLVPLAQHEQPVANHVLAPPAFRTS